MNNVYDIFWWSIVPPIITWSTKFIQIFKTNQIIKFVGWWLSFYRNYFKGKEKNRKEAYLNIELFHFLTFFYIDRRKYWFRANFRFPVFDRFTRFGMSWTRFDYFWKMSVCLSVCVSVCVCDKNFVASVARELMHGISRNFILSITPT